MTIYIGDIVALNHNTDNAIGIVTASRVQDHVHIYTVKMGSSYYDFFERDLVLCQPKPEPPPNSVHYILN